MNVAWTSLQLGQAFAAGFCGGAGFVGFVYWLKERRAASNRETKDRPEGRSSS